MTAILPQGLINATATVEQEDALNDLELNLTNSEVLRKFWKVYAVQSELTRDNASTRSRNLFWRVWSSPTLTQSIPLARLMNLWRRCGQDFDLTPIGGPSDTEARSPFPQDFPSPRQVRNRSSSLSPITGTRQNLDSSPIAGPGTGPSLEDFRFSSTPRERRAEHRRLSGGNGDDTSGSTSHNTSASSSRPPLARTTSGGRPKLPVLANAGKARARPSFPRRKSSSQKSPIIQSMPRSPRPPPESSRTGSAAQESSIALRRLSARGPPPGLPEVPSTASAATFALPSASSWQSVDSAAEKAPLATTAPALTSSELVDRDFRGRFVETQKKLASSTNLAALGRMKKTGSVVRFADEIPQDLRKGKGKEVITPLRDENIGPSRLRSSAADESGSDDESDEDDHCEHEHEHEHDPGDDHDDDAGHDSSSDILELPRTKSQLSLLIQNKRDENGGQDLGPEAKPAESTGKGKEKGKAKSKEEELLSMGRRDGVTKAGGVQVPRPQRVSEHDDPGYSLSSSPEPLF